MSADAADLSPDDKCRSDKSVCVCERAFYPSAADWCGLCLMLPYFFTHARHLWRPVDPRNKLAANLKHGFTENKPREHDYMTTGCARKIDFFEQKSCSFTKLFVVTKRKQEAQLLLRKPIVLRWKFDRVKIIYKQYHIIWLVCASSEHNVRNVTYAFQTCKFFKLWSGSLRVQLRSHVGVESCKIALLGGHFLFTCSDSFVVRCIV